MHPLVSLTSHRQHLAPLIARALECAAPDLVAVTRGPGMVASLAVGLDTAKGLAVGLRVPLVGVNHMLAHALTPQLMTALDGGAPVAFPFLTVLVTGGHTLLVHSRALTSHRVLAETIDIAVGDMVDKAARELLPAAVLAAQGAAVAYGRLLEDYCFPRGAADWDYHPPGSAERKAETRRKLERFGDWKLSAPLTRHPNPAGFSFSGLGSGVRRAVKPDIGDDERRALGREAMMIAFEHVVNRAIAALKNDAGAGIKNLVVSGGVASNKFLRHVFKECLTSAGFGDVELVVPPMKFCTDNAAMVAWAGLEIYRTGWRSGLEIMPIRKWSLDDDVPVDEEEGGDGGGVLGVKGWVRLENDQ